MLFRSEEIYLRHGRAFCDWLVRNWRPGAPLPPKVEFMPDRVVHEAKWTAMTMFHCSAMPLWHLHRITGEAVYVPPLVDAADRILVSQRPEGAFDFIDDRRQCEPPRPHHHEGYGQGDERYIIRNDDGLAVGVLAAHRVTGDRKYLDAMVRYADWIVGRAPLERPVVGYPLQANNVWDIGRVAGKDYTGWIFEHLARYGLRYQVEGTGDVRADGGFCGEDEEGDAGIYGGKGTDYVVTRTTCYMAGLLFRLSGLGTGAGFSVFGLGQ